MHLPKISIVTPSFNQGQFLEESICSVINQEYSNLEYIIIDGGSSDNSVEIIRKYENHLHYWVSEKDTGFSEAINKGFKKATGDIFSWLNSDDILLPGALNTISRFFQQFPRVGIVYGDRLIIDEQSNVLAKRQDCFFSPIFFRFEKSIPQESTFWRKDLFYQVGGLDEELNYAIDFDLWCRLSKITKIKYIPFLIGAFRKQPLQKSQNFRLVGDQEKYNTITTNFGWYPPKSFKKIFKYTLIILKKIYIKFGIHQLRIIYYQKKLSKRGNITLAKGS